MDHSDSLITQTIAHPIALDLVDHLGHVVQTDVTFEYRPADPYAVTLVFDAHGEQGEPVRWEIARDLLESGLFEPSGAGDVELWPCLDTTCRAVTMLELYGADGSTVVLQAQSRHVRGFLEATYEVVPEGAETGLLDLDGLVDALLGRAAS